MKQNNHLLTQFNKIRKLAIIALFADDILMETFVLKGGNAINLIYGISDRSSIDIDVSMANDFNPEDLENVKTRLENSLTHTFAIENYEVFDVKLTEKPKTPKESTKDFWGGYSLVFKVIEKTKTPLPLESKRKQALPLGPNESTKFQVDISKFEYCTPKQPKLLDDYTIFVYSPLMLVYEKLRAICQQTPAYAEIVHQQPRPRARDFYDIHTLITHLKLQNDLSNPDNLAILEEIFNAKKVPLTLLSTIGEEAQKAYHTADFESIRDTITAKHLETFDFYFNYVATLAQSLHSLRIKQPPPL